MSNQIFSFSDVPTGAKSIKMKMMDLNASYGHGGGTLAYAGEDAIQPGAFQYNSPCPPDGAHTYEWTAEAISGDGKSLGEARATKDYDGW